MAWLYCTATGSLQSVQLRVCSTKPGQCCSVYLILSVAACCCLLSAPRPRPSSISNKDLMSISMEIKYSLLPQSMSSSSDSTPDSEQLHRGPSASGEDLEVVAELLHSPVNLNPSLAFTIAEDPLNNSALRQSLTSPDVLSPGLHRNLSVSGFCHI